MLLSPPETSGALGALGALRQTSAPPGTRDVNMFPLEGSGESRRAQPQRVQEENYGELRRVQEHLGKARRAKGGQGGPGGRRQVKTQKKMFTTGFEPTT